MAELTAEQLYDGLKSGAFTTQDEIWKRQPEEVRTKAFARYLLLGAQKPLTVEDLLFGLQAGAFFMAPELKQDPLWASDDPDGWQARNIAYQIWTSRSRRDVALCLIALKASRLYPNSVFASHTNNCAEIIPLVWFVDDGGNPRTLNATIKKTLEISNRVTTEALPGGWLDTSDDRDNFKVEVFDPDATGDEISSDNIHIEVLKPNGKPFSPPRTHRVALRRVGSSSTFRSRYLRLVVDDVDRAANPAQTLLTDWDESDPTVGILRQRIRVQYSRSGEVFQEEVVVGARECFYIKLAIHILRAREGGPGVVTEHEVRRRIRSWFRRVYAQVSMAPNLLLVRTIEPAENLISISNRTGNVAIGGGVVSFEISLADADGEIRARQMIGPYWTVPGAPPRHTAQALADLVQQSEFFRAVVVVNRPLADRLDQDGSADIIIRARVPGRVLIDLQENTDSAQSVEVGRVHYADDGDVVLSSQHEYDGSIQQRTLLHACDTGPDRVDIVLVRSFDLHDVMGQAIIRGEPSGVRLGEQPRELAMSAFIRAQVMDEADDRPFTCAHEVGHVLMDLFHADSATQLMRSGTSDINEVDGSKRISEDEVEFVFRDGSGVDWRPVDQEGRMLSHGVSVLIPLD